MTSADPVSNWYWQIWSLGKDTKRMHDHWFLVASGQFKKCKFNVQQSVPSLD